MTQAGDTCPCCGNGKTWNPKACGACDDGECQCCEGTGKLTVDTDSDLLD